MRKTFYSNLGWVLLVNLAVKPFWILGVDREVQNVLGSEAYGTYYTFLSLSMLLSILADLGLSNYNNQHLARHPNLLGRFLSMGLPAKMGMGLLYGGATLMLAMGLGYRMEYWGWILLFCLNQWLNSLFIYCRSLISALHFFKRDSLLSALDKSLMIVLLAPLLWWASWNTFLSWELFLGLQTVSLLLANVVALYQVNKLNPLPPLRLKNMWQSRVLIQKSWPFALLVVLMGLYTRADVIMIERLLPQGRFEAGLYAQGYRLLDALNMLAFLMAGLLLPMFSRVLGKGQDPTPLLKAGVSVLFPAAIVFGMSMCLYDRPIMELLYRQDTHLSTPLARVLLWGFIPGTLNYVFGTFLTAAGRLRTLNRLAILAFLLNISLNLAWIPQWGALGAAWATLVTQSFMALVQIGAAVVFYRLPLVKWIGLRSVLSFLLSGLGIWLAADHLAMNWKGLLIYGMLCWVPVMGLWVGRDSLGLLKSLLGKPNG